MFNTVLVYRLITSSANIDQRLVRDDRSRPTKALRSLSYSDVRHQHLIAFMMNFYVMCEMICVSRNIYAHT